MDWKILATVFATVFVAELGDKTQLATLLFAADKEVNKWIVFFGASLALVATSALGVIAGSAIAHYVSSVLLPMSDAGIDLHSGGSTSEYLPCSFLCTHREPEIMAQVMAMAMAFGAPYAYVVDGAASSTGLDPVAHDLGVPLISTELAGGASLDLRALKIGREGVFGVLRHLGVLAGDGNRAQPAAPQFLKAGGQGDEVTAPMTGLFEPYCSLGEEVQEGDPAGAVHALEEPERAPVELRFARSGVILARRVPARVKAGDTVYQLAHAVTRDEILAEIKASQAKP